jgi:anti-sigma factor RsiW
MNDHMPTCEFREEAISLLAAGCLTPDEEDEVRQHLTACPACRERFEQIIGVCHGLQAARPPECSPAVAAVVSRAMAEIANRPTLVVAPAAAHSRSTSRWTFVAAAAIAASVLVVVSWRSFFDVAPRLPDVVRHDPPKSVPVPKQEPRTGAVETTVGSSQPTWLALQRAVAQSDEALDALLGRGSETLHFPPLDTRSLYQESDL